MVTALFKNKSAIKNVMQEKFSEAQELKTKLSKKPEDLELAASTALAEKVYSTYKGHFEDMEAVEQQQLEALKALGAPDEDFSETTTETIT